MNAPSPAADAKLLVDLQRGVPIEARPFAAMGRNLGMTEEAILARVRDLFESGVARRFGAVFDSRSLGYASTLCAADVPAADLAAAAARIVPHPGITHCYERDGRPNLWFTLTAPAPELARELARVSDALGYGVLNLPALRKFKIEAVFGRDESDDAPPAAVPPRPAPTLTERERQTVRRLQADLPVSADPFGALAADLGYAPAEFLAMLRQWRDAGIIRRVGLILRHRTLGFSANSMCVWPVAADRIEQAGTTLARSPHVTHCYERPSSERFAFTLYAMIHARSREEAVAIFRQLDNEAGLAGGRMMWSVREFKKSSPVFFCEPGPSRKPGAA